MSEEKENPQGRPKNVPSLNQLQIDEIIRLHVEDGLSYREIAPMFDVTPQNVGYHVRTSGKKFLRTARAESLIARKTEGAVKSLEWAKRELREAWEKSKEGTSTKLTRVSSRYAAEGRKEDKEESGRARAKQRTNKSSRTTETTRQESYGNPEYIRGYLAALKQESELLGLDAPKRTINKNQNLNIDMDEKKILEMMSRFTPEMLERVATHGEDPIEVALMYGGFTQGLIEQNADPDIVAEYSEEEIEEVEFAQLSPLNREAEEENEDHGEEL